MNKDSAANFPDTEPEIATSVVEPVHAGWPTRVLYCLALVALVLASLAQASSFVGLVTGGGLIGWAGPSAFLLVSAALAYRIYRVLRYRQALDARPPNALATLLRGLAWLLMLAGALGAASLFLVKPLTLMIFKSGGEAGVGFFVVGMFAAMAAGVGWIGCLLFEASRPLGKRVTLPAPPRSVRQRRQDGAVLAGLMVLALALPWVNHLAWGDGCPGKTFAACTAKVEGGVKRLAMAPVGAPVALQSNLETIEFRHTGGREWMLAEKADVSLLKSGHPVVPAGGADVQVTLDAAESDGGVLIKLIVTEKGQETASFSTRFKSGARLQPATDGRRKLVVDLPRNVERPFRMRGDGEFLLDEIYRQMRTAIGSEREVAEAAVQVRRTAKLMTATASTGWDKIEEARPAKSCDGLVKVVSGNAETDLAPYAGSFRHHAIFVQQPDPAPMVLLHRGDRVGCHGGAVWFAADMGRNPMLQIRRYDSAAVLQRNLLVNLPARQASEYQYVDVASFVERGSQLEYDLIVRDGHGKQIRERFSVGL